MYGITRAAASTTDHPTVQGVATISFWLAGLARLTNGVDDPLIKSMIEFVPAAVMTLYTRERVREEETKARPDLV